MSTQTADWTPVTPTSLPANNAMVEVITPGGDQRKLYFQDGLWFLPDRSMYVYFVPSFYRYAFEADA